MPQKEPNRPDYVTVEWLNDVLRQAGLLKSSKVESIEKELIGEGKAWLSTVFIVRVRYDSPDDNAPRSFVLKILTESRAARDFRYELDAYSREINFYSTLAKKIPIRLPELYYSQCGWYENFILMEDLSGLTHGDLVAGMSPGQIISTLQVLSKVHAVYWKDSDLNNLRWLPKTNNTEEGYELNWGSFTELCGGFIDSRGLNIGQKLRTHIPWLLDEISKSPMTLTNDDMKADNLLFGEPGSSESVVILDWQFSIYSLGAIDVARLIGGSKLPNERSGRELEALKSWYEGLLENGVKDYSWDQAQRDFKLGALYNLLFPVRYHRGITRAEGRALEYIHSLYGRLFSFASEIEADSILPG